MSKKMKIGMWIAVCCIIIGLLVYTIPKISLWYQLYQINLHWYDIENFEEYQDDFQVIADITKDFFENNPLGQIDDYHKKYVFVDNTGMSYGYDSDSSKETEWYDFPLTEAQQESAKVVCSLPEGKTQFSEVRYYDNQITFCMDMNNAYAIVYTFDGEKPRYMTRQNAGDRIGVEKIDDHWYHVITKGGLLT